MDKQFTPRPELLSAPNIPKPLHGMNPRTIMGQAAWDVERRKVYESTGHHCAACGVHKSHARKYQRMEAHEIFDIDYEKGSATLVEIVPLCHFCHAFIHSGFSLVRYRKGDITRGEFRSIMEHGRDILRNSGGRMFAGSLQICDALGVDTSGIRRMTPPRYMAPWGQWRMIWNGNEHKAKYASHSQWLDAYGGPNG